MVKVGKKSQNVYDDNQVLIALGDLSDLVTISESGTFEILKNWKEKHAIKSPHLKTIKEQ